MLISLQFKETPSFLFLGVRKMLQNLPLGMDGRFFSWRTKNTSRSSVRHGRSNYYFFSNQVKILTKKSSLLLKTENALVFFFLAYETKFHPVDTGQNPFFCFSESKQKIDHQNAHFSSI